MSNDNVTIGDKEYTREELLKFGKLHYPKFYWIFRGTGIGLMFIGLISVSIFLSVMISTNAFNDNMLKAFYITYTIFLSLIAVGGLVLFIISFKKKPDEAYIKHAIDYYTKLDANTKAREARIRVKEEKKAFNEENRDIGQLLKYKELLDAGIITQEEFDKKKKELLG